ncbi:hypothetical protein A3A39_02025 [Candidatus Kaiserbacteria bacterium RIFCSPLOWO2_01_FULL_54_13]|uniref:HTH deoR-type domain-containing protein n=1 Tax=Candidatus Kaiserbacteria bacterium RIFCSPLOWO2_01_FULL_54_13 TaxID=1798512 RepID=A0A1F6F0H4_9BACT|nr:MAG: hypothetical protein A3A39_02025 [Candidatus Kaiserbacteria bacterium RIFCSPLOWO2_01_FULL_54_13]
MDEIRDVTRKDQISRFLDNRTLRVQPFGQNVSADRAYRRAERIVAAIYLVTNHISPDEPARATVRGASLHLLSFILMLRNEMRSPESSGFQKAQAVIRKLISLVRVLSVSGHVSLQNSGTLVDALDELGNFLTVSQRSTLSESIPLRKDGLLDTESLPASSDRLSAAAPLRERKARLTDKIAQESMVSDRGGRKQQRTQRIVGILTSQGQLGIKDISTNLPEYSEKMIQRELKSLVTHGRVKKMGSKRWSMYALA